MIFSPLFTHLASSMHTSGSSRPLQDLKEAQVSFCQSQAQALLLP